MGEVLATAIPFNSITRCVRRFGEALSPDVLVNTRFTVTGRYGAYEVRAYDQRNNPQYNSTLILKYSDVLSVFHPRSIESMYPTKGK